MKFQFPYQKVLDVKEKEKVLAEQEFSSIKARAMELQEQLEGLEQVKEQTFHQYNDFQRKTVWEMIEFQQEIEFLNQQTKRLEHESQKLLKEVEQKQQMLIEKTQEAKIWNQWKSKSLKVFQKQMEQQEQAMFDEMAVIRHFRNV